MSDWYKSITAEMRQFIAEQKVFFVATSPHEGRINLSPKGMDTFRVLDETRAAYLDLTGSGRSRRPASPSIGRQIHVLTIASPLS